jgi:hypothetical protein
MPDAVAAPIVDAYGNNFSMFDLLDEMRTFVVSRLPPRNTFNLDVTAGRIAFGGVDDHCVVDPTQTECDRNHVWLREGDGSLHSFSAEIGGNGKIIQGAPDGNMRLTTTSLFWNDGFSVNRVSLNGGALSRICDASHLGVYRRKYQYFASVWGEASDDAVGCIVSERSVGGPAVDRNGDGDVDDWVLRVWTPTRGETELGLALNIEDSDFIHEPVVRGSTVVFAVDEAASGRDLDGDGMIGSPLQQPLPPAALYTFDATTETLRDLGATTIGTVNESIRFFEDGLTFVTPDVHRTILRDLDHDGVFEEPAFDTAICQAALMDNCATVANPCQDDADRDGRGDACGDAGANASTITTAESCTSQRCSDVLDHETRLRVADRFSGRLAATTMIDLASYCGGPVTVRLRKADGSTAFSQTAPVLRSAGPRRWRFTTSRPGLQRVELQSVDGTAGRMQLKVRVGRTSMHGLAGGALEVSVGPACFALPLPL